MLQASNTIVSHSPRELRERHRRRAQPARGLIRGLQHRGQQTRQIAAEQPHRNDAQADERG
jgi:hypothetical protein